jgi:hypothetical protein
MKWHRADVAQLAEHLHGKEKVVGSTPTIGSYQGQRLLKRRLKEYFYKLKK